MLALDIYRLAEALAYTDARKFATPLESQRSCETAIQEGKTLERNLQLRFRLTDAIKRHELVLLCDLPASSLLTSRELPFKAMQGFLIRNIVKINIVRFESC